MTHSTARSRRLADLVKAEWLVRAFPTWNARSMFAAIKPNSRRAASDAG